MMCFIEKDFLCYVLLLNSLISPVLFQLLVLDVITNNKTYDCNHYAALIYLNNIFFKSEDLEKF